MSQPYMEGKPNSRNIMTTVVMFSALAGLMVLGWFAYEETKNPAELAEIPLITKNPEPFKIKPDDPGGMHIPNQDKIVYNVITNRADMVDEGEAKILPPPEEPVKLEEILAKRRVEKKAEVVKESTESNDSVELSSIPLKPKSLAKKAVSEPKKKVVKKKVVNKKKPANNFSKSKGHYVQLGSYKTIQSLKKGQNSLTRKFPSLLGNLSFVVNTVDLDNRGVFYRLNAGPLRSKSAAVDLCNKMIQNKQGCLIAR